MAQGAAQHIFEPIIPGVWSDCDGHALIGRQDARHWIINTHGAVYHAVNWTKARNIGASVVLGARRSAERKKHMAELNLAPADAAPMKRARDALDDLQDVARMADNARMQEVFAKTKPAPRFKKLSRGLVAMVLGR